MSTENLILNGFTVDLAKAQEIEIKGIIDFVQEQTIKSEWIINALKKGVEKIDIRNATITGDLCFIGEKTVDINESGIEAKFKEELIKDTVTNISLISTSINIVNCQVEGDLILCEKKSNPILFKNDVSFKGTTFKKSVTSDYAIFNGEVNFEGTIFEDKGHFKVAKFWRETNFDKANFTKNVYYSFAKFLNENKSSFINTKFREEAFFLSSEFRGQAYFSDAVFDGDAEFGQSKFNVANFGGASFNEKARFVEANIKKAIFENANFHGVADFKVVSFENLAKYNKAVFNNEVYFSNVNFGGEADFGKTTFNDSADFSNSNFRGKVNFEDASFKEEAIFNKTKFSKVIDLSSARYVELQISWPQLEGRLDDLWSQEQEKEDDIVTWQGVYLKLIKNFENIGGTKSAHDAYYHYRCKYNEYKNLTFNNGIRKKIKGCLSYLTEYIFLNLTCGYGVKPIRSLTMASILILIFTFSYFIPYFFNIKSLAHRQDEINTENEENNKWFYCLYNSFYFSVMTFTTVGYGDYSPKKIFKAVAMLEGILGWLTLALFLVTLANVWLS